MKKIMIIDGNSIMNRAFYGLPLLSNKDGIYTNAVYGFLNILFKLIDEENPEYLCVAFDLSAPTFRHKTFEGYKGTRKGMPEELRPQMSLIKEVLRAMDITMFEIEGYEADDILGTVSLLAESSGLNPVVISGDRDLLQIASKTLKVRIPKTKMGKTETEDYFENDVIEKYGVTPKQFIEVKALMGDTSDNIPGVPGIGEKTAVKIIQEYDNIENAIENYVNIKPKKASENLNEFKEQARLSRFLAEIERNVPISVNFEEIKINNIFTPKAYELFKKLGFKSILERFVFDEDIEKNSDSDSMTLKVKENILVIDTIQVLNECIKELDKLEEASYTLYIEDEKIISISLCCGENKFYVFNTNNDIGDEKLVLSLKSFFENKNIKKIAHDAKNDIRLLRKYDVALNGLSFDTAIAAYILNPVNEKYDYDDIANEFLNEGYKSEVEIFGKGKSRVLISDLESDIKNEYLFRQSDVFFRSKKVMDVLLKEHEQEKLFYEIEMPLIYVLADMEMYGIKINKGELEVYQNELEKSILGLTNDIYNLAGEEFNINSPKQLGVILFEKLGLKGSKKTKTGYSTAAEVLEKLKEDSPLVEKILSYRQLMKLKSTYADGLLNVMDKKTNKIYSTFNQTITATGRISSTEPNLQNIPVRLELGRQLRKVFIPTSDEYVFLDADYSQIELRVLAHMADDETLINAFKNGQDIHRLTASQVFGIPFDDVTSEQRSGAKAVNFGIIYGIGAFSLSQDLGITRKEAEKYIEGYFSKYPKIKTYMDKTIADATQNGYVSTIFGRRRDMPELSSKNFIQRSFGERVAMNMPIQGSAADIIKIAMVKVYNSLKERNLKSKLILQVHDELLVETHEDEIEIVKEILKNDMENAVSLKVSMEVDVHSGNSWFEAK